LQELVPHLTVSEQDVTELVGRYHADDQPLQKRALFIRDRLAQLSAERDAVGDALRLAGLKDGLFLDSTGPRCSSVGHTSRLRAALAAAQRPGSAGEALRLPCPSGVRLELLVVPRGRVPLLPSVKQPRITLLLIRDQSHLAQLDPELLQTYFDLTPAEARIAAAIASGQTITQAATSLRLTRGTVRWYVKQLMAKTGTSTQAQMVRLLLSGLASCRVPPA